MYILTCIIKPAILVRIRTSWGVPAAGHRYFRISRLLPYCLLPNKGAPTIICSFPGAGMVGTICTGYIIEQLELHQIAFVDSRFTLPGVIYIGEKLRHPFRLYSNPDGRLCVINCNWPSAKNCNLYMYCHYSTISNLFASEMLYSYSFF